MDNWHPNEIRRLRGHILTMLCARHRIQKSRYDDVALTRMLQSMALQVSVLDVVTCLQDLADRDWVKFDSMFNEFTNRTELSKIELRPDGRDLVEQTRKHAAVDFGRG